MRILSATSPGDPLKPNEDWISASPGLCVVIDGATARTETGCAHGIAWYAENLGQAIDAVNPSVALREVLRQAIKATAALHPECDLDHPGTPSAAVGIVRWTNVSLDYLVLADVTLVLELGHGLEVITDNRVDETALPHRRDVLRHPLGSPEREHTFQLMKKAEYAARNRPGGFWVAATDPEAASEALTGTVPIGQLKRFAVMTDGASRAVDMFGLLDWPAVLTLPPAELIRLVRETEALDPQCVATPRHKSSDDASAMLGLP